MPYTYKSLALLWAIVFGLFALTSSGLVAGPWVILVLAVALSAPALILRDAVRVAEIPGEDPRVS